MGEISYRRMDPEEVDRIAEIDRAEEVRIGYEVRGGDLRRVDVQWDIPNFLSEGEGEHTVQEQIEFCQSHLDRDGILIGAFEEGVLVGIGLLQPEIRKELAQIAYLHVSNGFRRSGIGSRLMEDMLWEAEKRGAEKDRWKSMRRDSISSMR